MKTYLSFLSPSSISYFVASYGAKIFVSGLVLITVAGVLVFVFLGWGITKEIPQADVRFDTVSEPRMQQALEVLNSDNGSAPISPPDPFD